MIKCKESLRKFKVPQEWLQTSSLSNSKFFPMKFIRDEITGKISVIKNLLYCKSSKVLNGQWIQRIGSYEAIENVTISVCPLLGPFYKSRRAVPNWVNFDQFCLVWRGATLTKPIWDLVRTISQRPLDWVDPVQLIKPNFSHDSARRGVAWLIKRALIHKVSYAGKWSNCHYAWAFSCEVTLKSDWDKLLKEAVRTMSLLLLF